MAFVSDDAGFMCAKQILGLSEAAAQFDARGCCLGVVRPPAGARETTSSRFPAVAFVADEGDALRRAVGLAEGGGLEDTVSSGVRSVEREGWDRRQREDQQQQQQQQQACARAERGLPTFRRGHRGATVAAPA